MSIMGGKGGKRASMAFLFTTSVLLVVLVSLSFPSLADAYKPIPKPKSPSPPPPKTAPYMPPTPTKKPVYVPSKPPKKSSPPPKKPTYVPTKPPKKPLKPRSPPPPYNPDLTTAKFDLSGLRELIGKWKPRHKDGGIPSLSPPPKR